MRPPQEPRRNWHQPAAYGWSTRFQRLKKIIPGLHPVLVVTAATVQTTAIIGETLPAGNLPPRAPCWPKRTTSAYNPSRNGPNRPKTANFREILLPPSKCPKNRRKFTQGCHRGRRTTTF